MVETSHMQCASPWARWHGNDSQTDVSPSRNNIQGLLRLTTLHYDFKMEEGCKKVEKTPEADDGSKNTAPHR